MSTVETYYDQGINNEILSAVSSSPVQVGAAIRADREIDMSQVVFGYIGDRKVNQTQKEEAIHEIMGGLLMQGQANFYAIVRFPKLHKAMGRFVIGNRLYKTPAKVVLED